GLGRVRPENRIRDRLSTAAVLLGGVLLAASCQSKKESPSADAIYFGGPILTMEGDRAQYAEALLVRDGRILFVGRRAQADQIARAKTRVDLGGRVLLPGFIDAHGHAFNAGFQKLAANLLPPPDGNGKDVAGVVALLKEWEQKNAAAIEKSGWIIGFGYDD